MMEKNNEILNNIRKEIEQINFKDVLLNKMNNTNIEKYKNFGKLEDEILLPTFNEKCFEVIDNYTKGETLLNYIEEQKYYEDGNYLNIISTIKNIFETK